MSKECRILNMLLGFILFLATACNQENKPTVATKDSAIKVPYASTHDAYDDTLRWSIDRIGVIMRVRDLHDSADNIYIDYVQGKNTYRNYIKARKMYDKEYYSVYIPLCNKLGIKPEGGKK